MKCAKVKKRLIAFIENDLNQQEHREIHLHLEHCEQCRQDFAFLKKLYTPNSQVKRVKPGYFLWEKIYLQIENARLKTPWEIRLKALIPRLAFAAAIFLLLISGIAFGVYLGSYSDASTLTNQSITAEIAPTEELTKETYLDAFDTIPPESIAGVYFSLQTTDKNIR